VGFNDSQDVPKALALAINDGRIPELEGLEEPDARHFLSRAELKGHRAGRNALREHVFLTLHQNAADGATSLHLPPERTIVMGAMIDIN